MFMLFDSLLYLYSDGPTLHISLTHLVKAPVLWHKKQKVNKKTFVIQLVYLDFQLRSLSLSPLLLMTLNSINVYRSSEKSAKTLPMWDCQFLDVLHVSLSINWYCCICAAIISLGKTTRGLMTRSQFFQFVISW